MHCHNFITRPPANLMKAEAEVQKPWAEGASKVYVPEVFDN